MMPRLSPGRPTRPVRTVTAVGLAVLGAAMVWLALAEPAAPGSAVAGGRSASSAPSASTTVPGPSAAPPTGTTEQADVRDRVKGLVLPESDPVAVAIPTIDVHSRLVELGLDGDGAMEVPEPARAGWYARGAAPGALGPAVIAGHVTWDGAPSVFHRLGAVRRGDRVTVTRRDGRTAVFAVTRVARFPKSRFPTQAVYGAIDHAGLRLITCGGTYDAARHTYLDNVVVFARLEAVRGSRR